MTFRDAWTTSDVMLTASSTKADGVKARLTCRDMFGATVLSREWDGGAAGVPVVAAPPSTVLCCLALGDGAVSRVLRPEKGYRFRCCPTTGDVVWTGPAQKHGKDACWVDQTLPSGDRYRIVMIDRGTSVRLLLDTDPALRVRVVPPFRMEDVYPDPRAHKIGPAVFRDTVYCLRWSPGSRELYTAKLDPDASEVELKWLRRYDIQPASLRVADVSAARLACNSLVALVHCGAGTCWSPSVIVAVCVCSGKAWRLGDKGHLAQDVPPPKLVCDAHGLPATSWARVFRCVRDVRACDETSKFHLLVDGAACMHEASDGAPATCGGRIRRPVCVRLDAGASEVQAMAQVPCLL